MSSVHMCAHCGERTKVGVVSPVHMTGPAASSIWCFPSTRDRALLGRLALFRWHSNRDGKTPRPLQATPVSIRDRVKP